MRLGFSLTPTNRSFLSLPSRGPAGQFVYVGALDLATFTGYQVTDSNGDPVTNVVFTGGTPAWIDGTGLTSGLISPASNGSYSGHGGESYDITSSGGSDTLIFNVTSNSYFAYNWADLKLAITANAGVGGTVINIRGNLTNDGSTRLMKNQTYASELVIDGGNEAVVDWVEIEGAKNFVWKNTEFHYTDSAKVTVLSLIGAVNGKIINNTIHGTYRNPLGDYSLNGSYVNPTGIRSVAGASGYSRGVVIKGNYIYDLNEGINLNSVGGGLTIEDNEIGYIYEDFIKLTLSDSGLSSGVSIQRNFCHDYVGLSTDGAAPHSDGLQIISSSLNDGQFLENYVVRQNIFMTTPNSRGTTAQGITQFNDGGFQCILKDPIIAGNIIIMDGTHPMTFEAIDGGIITNNTLIHMNDSDTWSSSTKISVTPSTNNPVVKNNISEDTVSGVTAKSELVIGLNGSTYAYDSVFDGTTFDATTLADVLTMYSRRDFGPADTNADGLPSDSDYGALGTGYGVYGTIRDSSNWSYDPSYEVA